jgi:phosphoribosyl 1,2-cyclic phosphodiesterase
MLSARFWGVRGSIPCPSLNTVIYGGNTACIEIRADERLIIIDLGTGIHRLGEWLMANDLKKKGKIDADIFITHTHWDHIMGFPMFSPIYISNANLRLRGPAPSKNDSFESIMKENLSYRYWPVHFDKLSAHIEIYQINETTVDLGGGLTVTSKFLNHPILCLGYRVNYNGKSIASVFDHEPFSKDEENKKISSFIHNADIVIHDAQYSEDEYNNHVGWGHASFRHAVEAAAGANVKKLVFFHHEPVHSDKQLKKFEKKYAKKSPVKVIMAKEGMIFKI